MLELSDKKHQSQTVPLLEIGSIVTLLLLFEPHEGKGEYTAPDLRGYSGRMRVPWRMSAA